MNYFGIVTFTFDWLMFSILRIKPNNVCYLMSTIIMLIAEYLSTRLICLFFISLLVVSGATILRQPFWVLLIKANVFSKQHRAVSLHEICIFIIIAFIKSINTEICIILLFAYFVPLFLPFSSFAFFNFLFPFLTPFYSSTYLEIVHFISILSWLWYQCKYTYLT